MSNTAEYGGGVSSAAAPPCEPLQRLVASTSAMYFLRVQRKVRRDRGEGARTPTDQRTGINRPVPKPNITIRNFFVALSCRGHGGTRMRGTGTHRCAVARVLKAVSKLFAERKRWAGYLVLIHRQMWSHT